MTALFVTGASGFIGRHVLTALRQSRMSDVRCLTRRPAMLTTLPEWDPSWECIPGDLLDTRSYAGALAPGSTVLHLAGAVGKCRPADFRRFNVEATRSLRDACTAAGCAHFVYVSSIAATYPDVRSNYYARSKRDAERLVREGVLAFTILRPTVVFGPHSAASDAMRRLALLPFPVVFGSGQVEVQPVDVDDLAAVIAAAAREQWSGETVDVGGPETLTLEHLLALIRAAGGRSPRRPLHVPLEPLRLLLVLLEPLLHSALPVTAGQLAAFAFSSRATPSARLVPYAGQMRDVRSMIARSFPTVSPDAGK